MSQIFKIIYNFLFFIYILILVFNLIRFITGSIQIRTIMPTGVFNDEKQIVTNIKFNDVIGLKDVKDEFNYYVDFIKNKDIYKKFDVKLPKGVLLVGPP